MPQRLPSRPSLDRLKRLAKLLLADARRGDEPSLARLRGYFPDIAAATARLHQAQTAIAREHGQTSWPSLIGSATQKLEKRQAKDNRGAQRQADASTLATEWFTLAEAGAFDRLWLALAVGKERSQRARSLMQRDILRYGRFIDALIEGLGLPNPRLRYEYAHALDTFGDKRAVGPLKALLDDPVPKVRWMAMHALTCEECGPETCSSDPELIARIAEHAKSDPSIQVRRHASAALGLAGWPTYLPTLRQILATATDPQLRRAAEFGIRAIERRLTEV
jgi:hypothetical protein